MSYPNATSINHAIVSLPQRCRIGLIALAIAVSAASLARSVFDLTHHAFPAASLGCAYFVLRLILEFGPRTLGTGKKVAMAGLVFAMVAGDALIGTAVAPHDRDTFAALRLLVNGLGFFGPELIIWALASSPPIHGTYRVTPHGQHQMVLPAGRDGSSYDVRLSLNRIAPPDYVAVRVCDAASALVQDLGILYKSCHLSTQSLPAGAYTLVLENQSPSHVDITIEVRIRSFHLG